MSDKKNRKDALKKSLLEKSLLEMSGGATVGNSNDILNSSMKLDSSSGNTVRQINTKVNNLVSSVAAFKYGIHLTPVDLNPEKGLNTLSSSGITIDPSDLSFIQSQGTINGKNRVLTLYDLITKDDGTFLSPDVDAILNRLSSLAQFKHLPSITNLAGGGSKRNRSKKNRK